jgi:hypothetical protein
LFNLYTLQEFCNLLTDSNNIYWGLKPSISYWRTKPSISEKSPHNIKKKKFSGGLSRR